MRKITLDLQVQPALLDEARKLAAEGGVILNQLMSSALAEKVSALRTDSIFRERAAGANLPEAIRCSSKPVKESHLPLKTCSHLSPP